MPKKVENKQEDWLTADKAGKGEEKPLGWEHEEWYGPGIFDRLSSAWPHERQQLHAGGWEDTERWVRDLNIPARRHVLDICCGEGGTAVYLAKKYGVRVTGIDIAPKGVEAARKRAAENGVAHLCTFVQGNVFRLPFANNTFDCVLGQDADGFSHPKRTLIFKEVRRVMVPGAVFGLQHHWIFGFPSDEVPDIKAVLKEVGEEKERTSAAQYMGDLIDANLQITYAEDPYLVAERHLRGCLKIRKEKKMAEDDWLNKRIALMDKGCHFGCRFMCVKNGW